MFISRALGHLPSRVGCRDNASKAHAAAYLKHDRLLRFGHLLAKGGRCRLTCLEDAPIPRVSAAKQRARVRLFLSALTRATLNRRHCECGDRLLRVIVSQELDEEASEHTPRHSHHHTCSNLFGCGDEKGIGILREDIKERAFDSRASDRLLHMDEIDQANLDSYLSPYGRDRSSESRQLSVGARTLAP